jgi:REP element-mobilizing transposase RayT
MLLAIYTPDNCRPAYRLYWSLSLFWKASCPPPEDWSPSLSQVVEQDGVRILGHRLKDAQVSQFLLSTKPEVAPSQAIRSVKGRLQYLVRRQLPKAFRRNYAIHSIGSVKREAIDNYIASQVRHHPMADGCVDRLLEECQIHRPDVDLAAVRRSSHGEFSHNLHLVLVHEGRWHEIRKEIMEKLRRMILGASQAKGHLLARAGILSDHVHLALGCGIEESPLQVALGYLNNLAYAQGMTAVYQLGFYVGTFGEYDLGAIRRHLPG